MLPETRISSGKRRVAAQPVAEQQPHACPSFPLHSFIFNSRSALSFPLPPHSSSTGQLAARCIPLGHSLFHRTTAPGCTVAAQPHPHCTVHRSLVLRRVWLVRQSKSPTHVAALRTSPLSAMSSHHSLQALLLALVLACVFASAVAQQSGPLCACPGCTRQPSLAPSSSYIKSHDFTCDDSHQLVMRRVAVAPHCDSTGCDRISLFITASGYRRLDTTSGCYVNATQQPVEAFPSHTNAAFSIRVRCDSGLQAGRNCSYWLSAQYDCVPIGMRLGWSTQVVWATPASPVGATSIIVPSSRSLDAQCALDSCAGCTTLSIPYGETAGISSGVCTTAGTGYAYPRPFMGSMYVAAVEASTRFRVLLSDRTTLTRAGGDLAYAGGSSSLLTPGAVNCYRNEQPQGQMIGGGYGTTNSMSALILCDSPAGCSVLLRITAGCADSRFPSDLSAPMDSCLNSCAAGAACSAGVCTCPDGFTGPDCDTPIVVPALVPGQSALTPAHVCVAAGMCKRMTLTVGPFHCAFICTYMCVCACVV